MVPVVGSVVNLITNMLVAQFLISTYLFLFPSVQGLQENTVFIK
jgi:hypothetical protein